MGVGDAGVGLCSGTGVHMGVGLASGAEAALRITADIGVGARLGVRSVCAEAEELGVVVAISIGKADGAEVELATLISVPLTPPGDSRTSTIDSTDQRTERKTVYVLGRFRAYFGESERSTRRIGIDESFRLTRPRT